ncbi:rab GTPase-activating protein 22-like isoform X2 [Nymphaea colorata]|uniref:rab GTPase-activating protein 22-like isoform X2 n=1 Tax=Nymphaea colorata TaxID=210225 RepID=UPI00129D7899|nr:rab GTPase-activating protein 22-like isoform X2 [Nymphaea colorata]
MVDGRSGGRGDGGGGGFVGGGIVARVSSMFLSATTTTRSGGGGAAVGGFWVGSDGLAIFVTAMAGVALAAVLIYSRRGSLKSPWSRRRRKYALSRQKWCSFFSSDGKLLDGGVKLLKKIRSGGIEPDIRMEVWPFLLGVYELDSTKVDRDATRALRRKEYEDLRTRCKQLLQNENEKQNTNELLSNSGGEGSSSLENLEPLCSEEVSVRQSLSAEEGSGNDTSPTISCADDQHEDTESSGEHEDTENSQMSSCITEEPFSGTQSSLNLTDVVESESSDSESSTEEMAASFPTTGRTDETGTKSTPTDPLDEKSSCLNIIEDYSTWQRIIRLDAIRANAEWVPYSPSQAEVSEESATKLAESVGLKDYDDLEPCRVRHAARLVAILEAYAIHDTEIGYCQGMSDLLAPIIAVMDEDDEAFWCFVGFMKKARHNFRLDEIGIRRQLNIVSKIIKSKDSHLYKHLEMLQAEDCFFVYRMVVVLFRRELNFEQTLCLWEVMWADQAAVRAGISKSAWGRIRQQAPPTDDLLLYAIAACVLQRRKLIIEKYSSMDEIMRECNDMAGQLDVWKLLDDAHDLVVTLHDKV